MKLSEKLVDAVKPFFVLYFLFVVTVLIVFSSLDKDKGPLNLGDQRIMENWTVTDPEGNVFNSGSSYRAEKRLKGIYTMTATLPEVIHEGDNFCFVIGGDCTVFVNGSFRADFVESRDVEFPGGAVKRFYMVVPLRPEDSGQEITFTRLGATRRGFVYQHTFVASDGGIYSFLMSKYGTSLMLSEILFIFSLVICLISVLMRFVYKRSIAMLYGSLAILVISAWLITNSYLYPFVFEHYHVDGVVNYLFCLMMPFNLVFYLDGLQQGRYRKIMASVLVVSVLSVIVWPILHFAGLFKFSNALLYIDAILGVQVLVVMGVLIHDTIHGGIKEYAYTAIGFLGFLVCAIFEIFILNFAPIMQDDIPMLVGLAFLLALTVVQQIYDLKRVREEGQRAVDISEAKSRFLASMSHEIRTPINAVLGMNEMILRENKDPEIEEYARSVKSSGQMLLMLVNDVLDFSKIEAGKMEINEAPFRLSDLLRSIMPMLSERADEKDLRLKTVIMGPVPNGEISDEFRIRQILINLINNAIKYTDRGGVALIVDREECDDPDRFMLKLSVRDTGRGISEEGQRNLFEAFSRADIRKNRSIEGTGLGLAIVKSIIDSMGGEIGVTSKEGEGSEFTVRIPVGIYDKEPIKDSFMEDASPVSAAENTNDYIAPDAKILVVDDNASNLKLVGLFLKRVQIVPDVCDSGKKAVIRCKNERYDLILLDHMMPELDGMETLSIIRNDQNSLNKDVPVIVLTANAVAGSRQVYLDAGFADYLTKPIDSAVLESTIKQYLPKEKVLLPGDEKKTDKVKAEKPDDTSSETSVSSLRERLSAVEGLDYDMALNFAAGQEDLLESVAETVAEDGPSNVEKMRAALESGDYESYGFLAHAVKGQLATIGLTDLSAVAKQHEFAAKEGNIDFIKENSESFFDGYVKICKEILK